MESLTEGIRLARLGAFEEALASFDEAVGAMPGDPAGWSHRAACLLKLGRLQEAADSLDTGLEAARVQEAELHRRRGNVLIRLERYAEAQASLARATELAPACANAWYDRGVCFLRLSLAPDAAESFRKTTQLAPAHADAWANLGIALAHGGRLTEAVEALGRAVELDPADAESWFQYGVCLGETGRHGQALAAYERALEIDGDDADVWNNLGVALHELERLEEARDAYDRALALDPGSVEAAENRRLLDLDLGAPDSRPAATPPPAPVLITEPSGSAPSSQHTLDVR
jgi:Flp pilus assembly protein TadD